MNWWEIVGIERPHLVIGVDEVGYGAWAGPLGVAAALVDGAWDLEGLDDSKRLEFWQREKIYPTLKGLAHSTFYAHQCEIDREGVTAALKESFSLVVGDLLAHFPEARVVIDGNERQDLGLPPATLAKVIFLPKADTLVPAVMAASVIAKVERDRFMKEQAKRFPRYGFERHVGYGTPQHKEALQKYGPCSLHRKSYRPIRALLARERDSGKAYPSRG